MPVSMSSITLVTPHLAAVRGFYDRHFDTWYPFDCGWYVLVRLGYGSEAAELGFMEPREGATAYAAGAMLNLVVDDVDALHARMVDAGETVVIPLADNPWGDRGFGVADPAGLVVYCHRPIEPAPEFRQFIQRTPAAKRGA